jgi:glycosyltransferase involved in cell wall biosynthesis
MPEGGPLHEREAPPFRSSAGQMLSPSPAVSVVIPHLNEPDDLRRCLRSLEAQKGAVPFEVIVVDNGSRELPEAVCSEFPRVRLELERSPGPGPARNRGARSARAPVISFIDADCLADENWIGGINEYFDRHPKIDFIAGSILVAKADPRRATAIEAYESIFAYRVQLYVERDRFAATGNMSVRGSVFRAVGPFGGIAISEDREWGQRATSKGFKLAFAPDIEVSTPACRTFAELTRRWDRAVAHDFEELRLARGGTVRWLIRTCAVAVSPLPDIMTILRSDKVSGAAERLLALACLVRIRLYRARKMLTLAFRDESTFLVRRWNRE